MSIIYTGGLMDFLNYINPLKHWTSDQYVSFWQALFNTLLQGVWSRFFAVFFLLLSIWLISKKQLRLGAIGMLFVFIIAYGFPIIKILGIVK